MLLFVLVAIIVLWNAPGTIEKAAAKLRGRLEETHSRRFELCRHFFLRFFDSELISDPSQARVVAGGVLGILLSLSILFGQAYYHKYRMLLELGSAELYHHAERGDVLFLITLSMAAAALLAILEWSALFPGLRDYLALASLPLRMREIFAAKFLALVTVAVVVITAEALPPSVLIPAMMTGRYATGCGWHVPGIFFGSLAGGLFVFFGVVALQGVLLNLLPVRLFPRVSLALQGILLAVVVGGLPFVFSIPAWYNRVTVLPPWAVYAPPFWFFSIDQILFGAREALILRLARIAAVGLFASAAAAIGSYLWSYRRHRVRVLEAPSRESAATRLAWPVGLVSPLLPSPRALGVFAFIAKSLARSRQHRLILACFGAAAAALISEGFLTGVVETGHFTAPRAVVIAVPLALSLFLVAGLRYLFRLPVELRANWLFRITEPGHAMELGAGIDRFLLYCGAIPAALLSLPLVTALLGWRAGWAVSLICFVLSMVLSEALLFTFDKIPFTSSYLPGRRTVIETVILCSGFAIAYIVGFAELVSVVVRTPVLFLISSTLAAAGWWRLRQARLELRQHLRMEFEDSLEPAVQLLGIERE